MLAGPGQDVCELAPRTLQPLLRALPGDGAVASFEGLPLIARLAHQACCDLTSCVDVTRWEKVTRELGCHRLSPAHFVQCLPYAYLPYEPPLGLSHPERRARPGKHLLRLAYRGVLPDSVLDRKKSWADAVISPAWLQAGARWMRQGVVDYPIGAIAAIGADVGGATLASAVPALRRWDERSPQMTVTGLAFWKRLFIEREPSLVAPDWVELNAMARARAA